MLPAAPTTRPSAGWIDDPDPEKDWKRTSCAARREVPGCDRHCRDAIQLHRWQPARHREWGNRLPVRRMPSVQRLATPPNLESSRSPALHSATCHGQGSGERTGAQSIFQSRPCYMCHPGSQTKCLRGAMATPEPRRQQRHGLPELPRQHGHGRAAGRQGWPDQPNRQSCHDKDAVTGSFVRHLSVFDASGAPRPVRDQRFATNANVPVAGVSLYRFSKGHGDLQCEACHGSDMPSSEFACQRQRAEYRTAGHTGTIAECTVCHSSVPNTATVARMGFTPSARPGWGATATQPNRARAIASRHGSDYRGSAPSRTSMARSFKADDKKPAATRWPATRSVATTATTTPWKTEASGPPGRQPDHSLIKARSKPSGLLVRAPPAKRTLKLPRHRITCALKAS